MVKKENTGDPPAIINDIGTKEIHQKHSTSLELAEGEKVSRVKIKDQLFIDKLLMKDLIDLKQHRTAEWILSVATQAGIYLKTPSMSGVFGNTPKDAMFTNSLMRFARMFRKIMDGFGVEGERVVHQIIIDDSETENQDDIELLKKILDYMAD